MATVNPFDLLGDSEEDPSQFIATVEQQKAAAVLQQKAAADLQQKKAAAAAQRAAGKKTHASKLPSKSDAAPPAQAVREASRGRGRGGNGDGRGYGRERGATGYNQEPAGVPYAHAYNNGSSEVYVPKPYDDGEWEKKNDRPPYRGPQNLDRHGGFSNGVAAEGGYPRREFDRRNSTTYRNDLKREGAGRANWGATTDEVTQVFAEPINENDKNVDVEKAVVEEGAGELKDNPADESPEEPKPVPVDNSMTLKEYEKILEEKRFAILALKSEERKVVVDKDLNSMQSLSSKKTNNEIFAKLGSDKIKTKEVAVKEERVKKTLSLNPSCYQRGLGRGRDAREGYPDKADAPTIKDNGHIPRGGYSNMPRGAPPVNDNHFPSLGGK